jgi:uncharacterized protein YndB with AHSA1/START domain
MPNLKKLQFSINIAAPVAKVYDLMIGDASYRDWTSAFMEGSRFEGSWAQGERIRFLAPSGEGMVAEIAENKPHEFISVRHLGSIANGVEDTQSESVRAWAPAYENYRFTATPEGTTLTIEQDTVAEYEDYMNNAWPKALERLKTLCESGK